MRSDLIILDNCDALSRNGFWPRMPLEIDPRGWLDNFSSSEMGVALALLESFIYLNEESTTKLLTSAFRGLGNSRLGNSYAGAHVTLSAWNRLRADMIVTYPTGEEPNASDSGHLFVRRARQVLGVDETQIVEPSRAVELLSSHPETPLVMIDDFAGSGDQFLKTWRRIYPTSAGNHSLASMSLSQQLDVYYVVPVITWMATQRITHVAPSVSICSGHSLSARYSVTDPRSVVVPPELRSQVEQVVRTASARAGITDAWALGYGNLALTLAFSHSVPDATLPIFWHESDSWKALVPRR